MKLKEHFLTHSMRTGSILLPKGDKDITKRKPQMNIFMKANKNIFSRILPSRRVGMQGNSNKTVNKEKDISFCCF